MISNRLFAADAPAAVTALYEAFAAKDPALLIAVLAPEFAASASAGMPLGVGHVHEGAVTALTDLWGVVHGAYDIAPVPETIWTVPDGTVVVHGWYRGMIRRSRQPVCAEFVHLVRIERDVIVELRQITDTVAWGKP